MGQLAGIARHDRPRGAMEELPCVVVTCDAGVEGDGRGSTHRKKRRQVALIEAESWAAAMAELGLEGEDALSWSSRRANLLVEGVKLPREAGKIIAIGKTLRIETTMECDPCSRMDEIKAGLKLALEPDWRGGVLGTVVSDGEIAIGDEVRIEQ
ncbi:MAG: MOSC domain-containing protein [Novosphingobium sp.]|nr:MOSC domain-containing protein [Novosphingobium sp.]